MCGEGGPVICDQNNSTIQNYGIVPRPLWSRNREIQLVQFLWLDLTKLQGHTHFIFTQSMKFTTLFKNLLLLVQICQKYSHFTQILVLENFEARFGTVSLWKYKAENESQLSHEPSFYIFYISAVVPLLAVGGSLVVSAHLLWMQRQQRLTQRSD